MNKLEVILDGIRKTRGEDCIIYDFNTLNPFIDKMVITSADNMRQVFAIANNVKTNLKEHDYDIRSFEGNRDSRWILIDADEIVVHVFLREERALYALDNLYADLDKVRDVA